MADESDKRGGARKGAGRKPGKKRLSFTFTWPEDLWQKVGEAAKAQGTSRSLWLEKLARAALEKQKLK